MRSTTCAATPRRWTSQPVHQIRRSPHRRAGRRRRCLAQHRPGPAGTGTWPYPDRRHYRPTLPGPARQHVLPAQRLCGLAQALRFPARTGADQAYVKGTIDGLYAISFGNNTFNLGFKAGSKIGDNPLPRYDLFQWGGFLQQSGYSTGQLLGENLQFARIVYYNKLVRQSLLEGVYAGMSLEAGRVGGPLVPGSPTGLLKSASIFLALDSPVGPLYLAYGRATAGVYSFYLFLGKPY